MILLKDHFRGWPGNDAFSWGKSKCEKQLTHTSSYKDYSTHPTAIALHCELSEPYCVMHAMNLVTDNCLEANLQPVSQIVSEY